MKDRKVTVHLLNGKKLSYYDSEPDELILKRTWTSYLASSDGAVRFGRFVVPKANVSHVEFN
jgi:hypothetical protein